MSAHGMFQLLLHLNPLSSFPSMPKLKESVQRSGRDRETQREKEKQIQKKDGETERKKEKKTKSLRDRKTEIQKGC